MKKPKEKNKSYIIKILKVYLQKQVSQQNKDEEFEMS